MRAALLLGLSMSLCAASHPNKATWAISGRIAPYSQVAVKACQFPYKFVAVYADSKLTTPMPNPFIADRNGEFTYFTNQACVITNGAPFWRAMAAEAGR